MTSDLLPLLDGVDGVWLELELLGAAQLPVEDDDDEDGQQDGNDHADNQPDAAALGLRRGDGKSLHSWTVSEPQTSWSWTDSVLTHVGPAVSGLGVRGRWRLSAGLGGSGWRRSPRPGSSLHLDPPRSKTPPGGALLQTAGTPGPPENNRLLLPTDVALLQRLLLVSCSPSSSSRARRLSSRALKLLSATSCSWTPSNTETTQTGIHWVLWWNVSFLPQNPLNLTHRCRVQVVGCYLFGPRWISGGDSCSAQGQEIRRKS